MTKQQDNTTRDYSQFSKAEAIKEIEKLTGLDFTKTSTLFFSIEECYQFENKEETIYLNICKGSFYVERWDYGDWVALNIPIDWLEQLSQLIPILFKNETEQSKTIKEQNENK